jgi:hypothetical protein
MVPSMAMWPNLKLFRLKSYNWYCHFYISSCNPVFCMSKSSTFSRSNCDNLWCLYWQGNFDLLLFLFFRDYCNPKICLGFYILALFVNMRICEYRKCWSLIMLGFHSIHWTMQFYHWSWFNNRWYFGFMKSQPNPCTFLLYMVRSCWLNGKLAHQYRSILGLFMYALQWRHQ